MNGQAYSHRRARLDDLAQIVAIYNSTIPSREVTADTEPVSVDSRLPWFDAHAQAQRPLWVLELDGVVAAWASFSSFYGRPAYSKTAELSIYVSGQARGRGIGAYLLAESIRHAPQIGVDTLLGFIFGHNQPSLALFRKYGFLDWGNLPGVALLDGVERDLIIVGRKV